MLSGALRISASTQAARRPPSWSWTGTRLLKRFKLLGGGVALMRERKKWKRNKECLQRYFWKDTKLQEFLSCSRARGVCERRVREIEGPRDPARRPTRRRQDIDLVQLLFVVVDALEALLCCGRGGGFEPIQFNSIQFETARRGIDASFFSSRAMANVSPDPSERWHCE
jgi:hypothetical protein